MPETTLVPVLPEGTPVPAKWQKQVAKAAGHNSVCLEVYERAEGQPDCEATLLARVSARHAHLFRLGPVPVGVLVG